MEKIRQFLARKDVVFTLQRYGIDALGAMAQGLFCTLLVGTCCMMGLSGFFNPSDSLLIRASVL